MLCAHTWCKPSLLNTWPGVLVLVQFNSFDRATQSYTLLLQPSVLMHGKWLDLLVNWTKYNGYVHVGLAYGIKITWWETATTHLKMHHSGPRMTQDHSSSELLVYWGILTLQCHSWGMCNMVLTNMHCVSLVSSGQCLFVWILASWGWYMCCSCYC